MDRRVKERLVGATILLLLVVLIVPELLSGPKRTGGEPPASRGLPSQTVTVEVHTHATTREPAQSVVPASAPAPVDSATSAGAMPIASTPAEAPTPAGASPTIRAPAAAVPAAAPGPAAPGAAAPTTASGAIAPAAAPGAAAGVWAVQFGSFAAEANANKLVRELKGAGYAVYVSSSGSGNAARFRVRMGPLADRDAAERAIAKLKAHGLAASIVPPAP